jgi:8-oxo-dGTP pyrophosphatase MutT (NUDIX family)
LRPARHDQAVIDAARRLVFRAGFRVLRAWWFVRRPTHRGAKCVITRGDQVLMIRHTYGPREQWDLPGGGVHRGEPPHEAARREAREELGVDLAEWSALGDVFERIDWKHDTLHCFRAEVAELDLQIDRGEIAEARWFDRRRPPSPMGKYVRPILALVDA